jgi:protein O-mannosyl-transferase
MCGVIIAAGVIAVYGRTLSVPLLFDDVDAIGRNLTIRHWSTALWPPPNITPSGRPVLNLSLAVNYAIGGTAVWSYHALNLVIHALAGLTLFGIVRRTLVRRRREDASVIAFGAALLWAMHPLQTESVTYIVQRAESLMGLFYLATMYCFIRGADADGWFQRSWFALSAGACLLGMATKEVMVSAPLIVLLYDRTFVAGTFREAWRSRWGLYVALAATWLLLVGLVASAGWDRNGMAGFDVGITPWAYWLTQFEAVVHYLSLSVWPHPLVFEYGTFWVSRPTELALYALVVIGLALAVLIALFKRSELGFLGGWFFAILAPTSIMPGRVQMIVEHRMYLSLAAVIVAGVAGLHHLLRKLRSCGPVVGIPSVPVAFVLTLALGMGLLTARRNEDYRSELSIWSDTVAKRPDNARAHNNLGNAWSAMPGQLNSAIAQFQESLRLRADFAEAHNNLGVAWAQMPGRLNDAIAQYQEALRLKPDFAGAHYSLGLAWAQIPGRLNDAILQYQEALRLKPDFAEAHCSLGVAWAQIPGRLNDAIAQYQEALRLKPDYAEAYCDLGVAWAQMPGRLNDAIIQYQEALRMKPDFAEAHCDLGAAWAQIPGRLNDAMVQYQEALRLKPDYVEAHFNLGVVWSEMPGRLNDAIAQYQEALRLKPDCVEAHYSLGVALTQVPGRLNDAIAEFEEALRLNPDSAPGWYNLGVSWFHERNLSAAATAFREALRLKPDDLQTRQALAAALREEKKRE